MGFNSKKLNKDIDLAHLFNFDGPLVDMEIENEALSTLGVMKTFYNQQRIREEVLSLMD